MRGSAIAASLALSLMAMSAAPVFAQTPRAAPSRRQPSAPPAAPRRPRSARAVPRAAARAVPGRAPRSRSSTRRRSFQGSADGRAAVTRVNALIQKKQTENADKAKLLQGNQQKLQTSGSVMNEAARVQLEKEIERQTKDAERFQQDAQAEINELQQEVQNEFVKKLSPIIEQLAAEKGLHIVFNAAESGIAWATPGLDLTADVVKKLDAATPSRRRRRSTSVDVAHG